MRPGRVEQTPLGHDHPTTPPVGQVVGHVLDEQQFRGRGRADLDVIDDAIAVQAPRKRRVCQDDVIAIQRQTLLGLCLPVEGGGQDVALEDAHIGQPAQSEVHGGKADHLGSTSLP